MLFKKALLFLFSSFVCALLTVKLYHPLFDLLFSLLRMQLFEHEAYEMSGGYVKMVEILGLSTVVYASCLFIATLLLFVFSIIYFRKCYRSS